MKLITKPQVLLVIIGVLCFFNVAFSQNQSQPIYLGIGIHNDYGDSVTIELSDPQGIVVFTHCGTWESWGTHFQNVLRYTGEYKLNISGPKDSTNYPNIQQIILLEQDIERVDISIVLSNSAYRDTYNSVAVDKYFGNKLNATLTSLWNPQEQFEKDSILLPELSLTNNHDSMLYGIHRRSSSSMSVNWLESHYITFMQFDVYKDSIWRPMNYSAPRIEMKLNKGDVGETLKDMILGWSTDEFQKGVQYRISIPYGINNMKSNITGSVETGDWYGYFENYVYQVFDPFLLK